MTYGKMSPKQLLAMLWWDMPAYRDRDAIICDGSIRSGKTMAMSVGFVLWSCTRFNNQTFALCGKTIEAFRRNVVRPMQTWLEGVAKIVDHMSNPSYMDITYAGHTNRYYIFGGRDESSATLIQGMTLAGVLLDEVALMPRSFVEQAVARCSIEGSKMWFNCNPDGPKHWYYLEWICKAEEKNALHLHFTMRDNYTIARNIRERYENLYTGVFYDRFILGKWVAAEGLVYPIWREEYILHGDLRISEDARWFVAIDYGTVNPFAAGLWAVGEHNAILAAEYYYNSRKEGMMRTDEEHYAALLELIGDKPVEYIVVDPSAASFIELIRRHGDYGVRKAKNEVLPGISRTANMIQQGKLLVHESCTGTLEEFGLYRWDDKTTGEDKVVKQDDHCMDMIRYAVNTIFRRMIMIDVPVGYGGDDNDQ